MDAIGIAIGIIAPGVVLLVIVVGVIILVYTFGDKKTGEQQKGTEMGNSSIPVPATHEQQRLKTENGHKESPV